MTEKKEYCRISGYLLAVDSVDERTRMYSVSTADENAFHVLNLEMRDRLWYVGEFSYTEIDCIWVEQDYEVVEIVKGNIIVDKNDFESVRRNLFEFRRYYAIYKGHKYIDIQGYNNKYIYKLGSYDFSSQDDGFIMHSPGFFMKTVITSEIELAYQSTIWCMYKGYKFAVSRGEGSSFVITPYSSEDYSSEFLESLGFIKSAHYHKTVSIDELTDLYVINEGTGRFKEVNIEPEIIKRNRFI